MHREPDVGFDPWSPGSRPGPKAGAKPLRHPGIPVTRVLPGHHRDMVTLFPPGTDLILVTLVLTLAFSLPDDSGSTWASPVTGHSDPKHGLT